MQFQATVWAGQGQEVGLEGLPRGKAGAAAQGPEPGAVRGPLPVEVLKHASRFLGGHTEVAGELLTGDEAVAAKKVQGGQVEIRADGFRQAWHRRSLAQATRRERVDHSRGVRG